MGKLFFKFFAPTDLSPKRLMYNELYFVSRDEINDPYDINVNKVLSGDRDQYGRIFKRILHETQNDLRIKFDTNPEPFINFFIENDVSSNTLSILNTTDFRRILLTCFPESDEGAKAARTFFDNLNRLLLSSWNDEVYIVSFSGASNHVLMWSHYAGGHSGFCLVFSAVDNSIYQDHRKAITGIDASPNVHVTIERKFQLEPVSYKKTLETLDALISMPGGIRGKNLTEDEYRTYWKSYRKAFLRKSKAWEYEEEYRLVLPFIFGGLTSRLQRLFHFDISQLTGLILGSKMKPEYATDLIESVIRLRKDFLNTEDYLPPFIFYRETLDLSKYTITHKPIFFLDSFNKKQPIKEIQRSIDMYRTHIRTAKKQGGSAQFQGEIQFLPFSD